MNSRLSKDHWLLKTPCAHRGLHNAEIPENSLLAYENACKNGFPIELDVQMTSDGYIVCFHDDNLKRMTGLDQDIRKTPYSTVKSLKLKSSAEIIPDFSEMLDFINGRVPLLIEVKAQLVSGIVDKVLDALKGYKGEYAIQSFDPRIMNEVRVKNPEIIRGQLGSGYKNKMGFKVDFALKYLPLNRKVKPDFINYSVAHLPISKLKSNGLPVLCWTVRSEEEKLKAQKYAVNYVFENILP